MIDHSNDCQIPGTGYCSCHGNEAAFRYVKAERDTFEERARYWRRSYLIANGYWILFAALVMGRDLGWWG